jgi:adenosine deaminase
VELPGPRWACRSVRILTSLIRTPADLARLIEEFVEDEAADGVLYTEPMFSPVLYAHRFRWPLE